MRLSKRHKESVRPAPDKDVVNEQDGESLPAREIDLYAEILVSLFHDAYITTASTAYATFRTDALDADANAWAWDRLASLALLALMWMTVPWTMGLLIGGKLAIASSAFLCVAAIVQRMDGERALTRSRRESPLQISLRSLLILMAIAGLACAWVGTYTLVDVSNTEPVAVEAP